MDMMSDWKVAEARQQFSEVLRRSTEEPQRIYRRETLVGAVIGAELLEDFERWREERRRQTLGRRFDEVREICVAEGYALDTGERRDRESWITDED